MNKMAEEQKSSEPVKSEETKAVPEAKPKAVPEQKVESKLTVEESKKSVPGGRVSLLSGKLADGSRDHQVRTDLPRMGVLPEMTVAGTGPVGSVRVVCPDHPSRINTFGDADRLVRRYGFCRGRFCPCS